MKRSGQQKFWGASDFLWLLPILTALLARKILLDRPALVEQVHVRVIFRVLSQPISVLTSLVPFSLTELVIVAGSLSIVVFLIIKLIQWLRRLFGKPVSRSKISGGSGKKPGQRIHRAIRILLYASAIAYLLFTLLHGLNYARMPVAESFGLATRPRTTGELAELTVNLAQAASEARADCLEDENGIFRLRNGVWNSLKQTAFGYSAASKDWPLLAGPNTRPKGVLLSYYWSYTGISGVYNPFFVEANVNIDQPHYTIPDTAGHELAHTRGFAREDEAGFISFLTGLYNPNPDFRYSVLANAYVRCANALYAQDPKAYAQAASLVSESMSRDLADNSRYWQQFAGPVSEASEQINNSYLKANQQTDGVRSYGRMVDLVLAYFEQNGGLIPNADR
jgi:hypothetical protein